MATEQWVKKLGGHAGELFVCAELSKRGIPNALLPENFSDDDVLVGNKAGTEIGFVQVKACHPDRSASFILRAGHEQWETSPTGRFCVFVWLGNTQTNAAPKYWIAEKQEVGRACVRHSAHGTENWERRFYPKDLPPEWENRWSLFDRFRPTSPA
ncbi:MAG: hypothetical protein JO209_09325 [Acidisphaera sp.]|nr:hypothetical protein [Acidisphaera sp.]